MGLLIESVVGKTSGTSTDRGGVVSCVFDLAVPFPIGIDNTSVGIGGTITGIGISVTSS